MEPEGPCKAEEESDKMVTCELEAAEALAGLARCSAVRGGDPAVPSEIESHRHKLAKELAAATTSARRYPQLWYIHQDNQAIAAHQLSVRTAPSQLWSTRYQSNSAIKSRQSLTEAEKEDRRIRRVLANRESARQTIRRREAMHLELTKKASNLSEENENLKKEKELAVKEYNTLKGRNEFLNLQMDSVKKVESRQTKELQNSSQAETATDLLHNQPHLLSIFRPSIFLSPNVFQLQYAPQSDVTSSSQSPMQYSNMPPFHQGQDNLSAIAGPGNPLFVLPVPWLLPVLGHSATLHSHSDTNNRQNGTPSTCQCSTSSSSDTMFVQRNLEASTSGRTVPVGSVHGIGHHLKVTLPLSENLNSVGHVENIRADMNRQKDEISDLNTVPPPEHMSRSTMRKKEKQILCGQKKPEDDFAATKARRRRKELMKFKNVNYHHS